MTSSCRVLMFPLLPIISSFFLSPSQAKLRGAYKGGDWGSAYATFYGGNDGSGTMGGACGYGDPNKEGYGLETAALSQAMFIDGLSCGQCFEIKCVNDGQWCKPGTPTITITGTNLCPSNPALPNDNGGWCNPPRAHFDLSIAAFLQIAELKVGIVPVSYRRISCKKEGGIRFTITGSRYFTLILVWNVAGAGDITNVRIKGDKTGWTAMKRNWGQKWQTGVDFTGQSLSFRVSTGDGRTSTSWHITSKDWQYGETYEGKNFKH